MNGKTSSVLNPVFISSIQSLLDAWNGRCSGQYQFIYADFRRTLFLYDGQISGCHSDDERDEPREILLKSRHPASLVLDSLKRDPTYDPFLPLPLVENGILSFAEFMTLMRQHGERFIRTILEGDPGAIEFSSSLPMRPVSVRIDPYPLIRSFIMEELSRERMIADMQGQASHWTCTGTIAPHVQKAIQGSDLDILLAFREPRMIFGGDAQATGVSTDEWERIGYFLYRLRLLNPVDGGNRAVEIKIEAGEKAEKKTFRSLFHKSRRRL